MRTLLLSISILLSVFSYAQTEQSVIIKLDTTKTLEYYMLKDYHPKPYLYRQYPLYIGQGDVIIPYKVIIPISWKFRSKKYYRTHNKIKNFY